MPKSHHLVVYVSKVKPVLEFYKKFDLILADWLKKESRLLLLIVWLKVRTFWETHKIWKNIPHGFDKSADLLSKHQNHEEFFFFQIMCASQKVWTLTKSILDLKAISIVNVFSMNVCFFK